MIEEVELLPQELTPRYEHSKKSILDVSCRDKKGHRYIVEMQNRRLSSFIQRLEYYASRTYSDQLFKGIDYLELKPVILLVIANHNIFPREIQCISYHCNREEETNKWFLPNRSYVFVELPKFSKCSEQLKTPEDYWIHLLKEASDENEPPKEAPSEIQEAYGVLERHYWSSAEIESYKKTMMAILDDEDAIRTAKNEGREEETKEIACKLLKKGCSHQDISDVTGLSTSKVEELSNQ